MIAKFRPLPNIWPAASQQTVVVDVTGGPPGQVVTMALFRTAPPPETQINSKPVNVTSNGDATASFSVTLSIPGINVLHCEVQHGAAFDSDSAGTLVQ
jgi:hypothetical protein